MKSNEFTDLILRFAGGAGVALTEQQAKLLGRHIEMMLQWNSRLNLTRITDPEEAVVKHLLDSILPAKFLPSSGNALDVGTGAGFPGIALKIFRPGLQMVLLDSSRKKISFLTAVSVALGLKEIEALHGRWEDFIKFEKNAGRFELITMRALRLEEEHITRLGSQALVPGGVLAWWGAGGEERLEEGRDPRTWKSIYQDMQFKGVFDYLLPGIKRKRAIWLWRKSGWGIEGLSR